MRPRVYDQRERERFTAYSASEAFYNGEPATQLTVLSTAKRDEVRAVFNYAHDILNKHAAATVNGLECHAEDAAAQRELDAALRNSNSFAADFSAVLGACVDGDGAFYVSHMDGEVFYCNLHPGDVEVLDWRTDGQPARVMVQFDDRIETWTRHGCADRDERERIGAGEHRRGGDRELRSGGAAQHGSHGAPNRQSSRVPWAKIHNRKSKIPNLHQSIRPDPGDFVQELAATGQPLG